MHIKITEALQMIKLILGAFLYYSPIIIGFPLVIILTSSTVCYILIYGVARQEFFPKMLDCVAWSINYFLGTAPSDGFNEPGVHIIGIIDAYIGMVFVSFIAGLIVLYLTKNS